MWLCRGNLPYLNSAPIECWDAGTRFNGEHEIALALGGLADLENDWYLIPYELTSKSYSKYFALLLL